MAEILIGGGITIGGGILIGEYTPPEGNPIVTQDLNNIVTQDGNRIIEEQ